MSTWKIVLGKGAIGENCGRNDFTKAAGGKRLDFVERNTRRIDYSFWVVSPPVEDSDDPAPLLSIPDLHSTRGGLVR
jgi:hypothetical protein